MQAQQQPPSPSLSPTALTQLTSNKMLRKCLKTLMHRLLHQFRSQSYNSNSVVNGYLTQLREYGERVKMKEVRGGEERVEIRESGEDGEEGEGGRMREIGEWSKGSIDYWDDKEYKQLMAIWPDISLMIWQLARSPRWYISMLQNQQIHAEQTQCIDLHTFTTKLYKRILSQSQKSTPASKLFESICPDQVYFFLQQVSTQICACFKSGQKIVVQELNMVTLTVGKSEIVNFYLLYKIMKDAAAACRSKIMHQLEEGLFRNIETEVVGDFAHYIIEKYEVLDMKMQSSPQSSTTPQPQPKPEKPSIIQRIQNANHIKWRQAIREDGQIGILVQLQDQTSQGRSTNYMLTFDDNGQLNIVNSNSINRQWKVCKKAQQNYDVLHLVKSKKALVEKMRTSTSVPMQMTLLENVGVLGGSMGKCLAEIDMYDNVGEFMISLSKRTIIGGSFNYLLMSVPLLGYIFVTGGFSYTFYYIFTNQYANSDKKMRQLRNITIGSATSIGSGLIGATVGQTLIPVPVLGAFVGGLVGGFLGEFGARAIGHAIQSARFKETVQQMKNTIQPKGYWQVTPRTLQILQIEPQKFYQTIPVALQPRLNSNKIWLTLLLFTLLCFHESRQRIKKMQSSMKKAKKLQKKMSDFEIIEANQRMGQDGGVYEPSIDFMCVLRYFQDNRIVFLEFHDEVAFLLGKVFSKIK